jgi:hypothetical protein
MKDEAKPDEENNPETPGTIRFVFQKGRHHRTFHADGAWAAVSPRLEVQCSFFNTLRPLPDFTVHSVTPGGDLEEVSRQISENIIRETDVTVVMPKEGVLSLIALLQRMVAQIDKQAEEIQQRGQSSATPEAAEDVV